MGRRGGAAAGEVDPSREGSVSRVNPNLGSVRRRFAGPLLAVLGRGRLPSSRNRCTNPERSRSNRAPRCWMGPRSATRSARSTFWRTATRSAAGPSASVSRASKPPGPARCQSSRSPEVREIRCSIPSRPPTREPSRGFGPGRNQSSQRLRARRAARPNLAWGAAGDADTGLAARSARQRPDRHRRHAGAGEARGLYPPGSRSGRLHRPRVRGRCRRATPGAGLRAHHSVGHQLRLAVELRRHAALSADRGTCPAGRCRAAGLRLRHAFACLRRPPTHRFRLRPGPGARALPAGGRIDGCDPGRREAIAPSTDRSTRDPRAAPIAAADRAGARGLPTGVGLPCGERRGMARVRPVGLSRALRRVGAGSDRAAPSRHPDLDRPFDRHQLGRHPRT